jgi:hypothetical protein
MNIRTTTILLTLLTMVQCGKDSSDVKGSVIQPPLQRREYCLESCEHKASGIESLTGDGKFKSKRYVK